MRAIKYRRPTRRNPAKRPAPSHDLFGERSHALSLFGEKRYQAVPKPAAKRGKPANAQQGALAFARGLFD
jgi:hypothetical protein